LPAGAFPAKPAKGEAGQGTFVEEKWVEAKTPEARKIRAANRMIVRFIGPPCYVQARKNGFDWDTSIREKARKSKDFKGFRPVWRARPFRLAERIQSFAKKSFPRGLKKAIILVSCKVFSLSLKKGKLRIWQNGFREGVS
jgi:hypothetical protein